MHTLTFRWGYRKHFSSPYLFINYVNVWCRRTKINKCLEKNAQFSPKFWKNNYTFYLISIKLVDWQLCKKKCITPVVKFLTWTAFSLELNQFFNLSFLRDAAPYGIVQLCSSNERWSRNLPAVRIEPGTASWQARMLRQGCVYYCCIFKIYLYWLCDL